MYLPVQSGKLLEANKMIERYIRFYNYKCIQLKTREAL